MAVVMTARTLASAVGMMVVVMAVVEMAVTENTALTRAAAKMADTNNVNAMHRCIKHSLCDRYIDGVPMSLE